MPNISIELAEALVKIKKDGIQMLTFLDVREDIYREGFGDIEALTILEKNNISVYDIKDFNISFIIVDNYGYFYFPKSRYFEKEGHSYDLILMSDEQTSMLIYIFTDNEVLNSNQNLAYKEIGDLSTATIKELVKPLDRGLKEKVEKAIKNNPPLRPDLERTLNVYTAKFKIIELKFPGANIQIKRVKLPENTLPINDSELNKAIEASLRLFTNIHEKEFFKPFISIKEEIELLRNRFFFHLKTRDKNLIRIEDLTQFNIDLNKLQVKLKEIVSKIVNELQGEIANTRKKIKNNLFDFLTKNPQKQFEGLKGDVLIEELKNYSSALVNDIHFPQAKELIKNVSLQCFFYDITWSDLNNQEVIKEMMKHKLITWKEAAYFEEIAISASEEK